MTGHLPGSSWSNPVWRGKWRIYRSHSHFHDFAFCHDDFDGTDDANDNRYGAADTIEEATAAIDEMEAA